MGKGIELNQAKTLRNQLVGAFIFITFISSCLYGALVYNAMKFTEDDILSRRVDFEARQYVEKYRADKQSAALPNAIGLTSYLSSSSDVPSWLKGQPVGNRELHDREVHIDVRKIPDSDELLYVVLSELEASGLERQQSTLMLVLLSVGVVISTVGLLLGVILGRYISDPLNKLTAEIEKFDFREGSSVRQLFYGHRRTDEVGALSRSFSSLVARLELFLHREKNFTRHASHELRNPLAVIKNSLALLQLPDVSERSSQKGLERIETASNEMGDLIELFLYLGREDCLASTELIDVSDTIESAIEKNSYLNEVKAIQVTKKIAPNVQLSCDQRLAKVLFDNIIRNMFLHGNLSASIELNQQRLAVSNDRSENTAYREEGDNTFGLSIIERISDHCAFETAVNSEPEHFTVVVNF